MVTMVWLVSRCRLKAPPGISSSCISPLTSSGQRSRASWASEPENSPTISLQPGGKPRNFLRTCGGFGGGIYIYIYILIGHAVSQLVQAQRYKPDGLGFDCGLRHWKFSLT